MISRRCFLKRSCALLAVPLVPSVVLASPQPLQNIIALDGGGTGATSAIKARANLPLIYDDPGKMLRDYEYAEWTRAQCAAMAKAMGVPYKELTK